MSKQDDPDPIIGSLTQNISESVAVMLRMLNGHRLVDMRMMAAKPYGGTMPTGKGVALKPDTVPDLVVLLQQADAAAASAGWCQSDGT